MAWRVLDVNLWKMVEVENRTHLLSLGNRDGVATLSLVTLPLRESGNRAENTPPAMQEVLNDFESYQSSNGKIELIQFRYGSNIRVFVKSNC